MGYLGRRIGLSQDNGDSNPGGAGGAVGGGILDLIAHGYFERQGDIFNAPGLAGGLTASGGIISDYTDGPVVYRAHIFTSSGALNVTELGDFGNTVEYLVVGGGGGGGGAGGANAGTGGGGAGGLRTNFPGVQTIAGTPISSASAFPVTSTSYAVVIGAGGAGGPRSDDSPDSGISGGLGGISVFDNGGPNPIRSEGGGASANSNSSNTTNISGGSGGGASENNPGLGNKVAGPPSGSAAIGQQGHAGGNNAYSPPRWAGGGGGGAGAIGGPGNSSPPNTGYGGAGVQVLIAGPEGSDAAGVPGPGGQGGWFAGGGAGGIFSDSTWALGGAYDGSALIPGGPYSGGGQGGGDNNPTAAGSGTAGTGGGGGGTGGDSGGSGGTAGGAGGSGIVVVRYQIAELTATAKATGGAISFYGSKTIHTFTNSGQFTNTSGSNLTVDHIIVAGGGGAGSRGGGGGAGGVRTSIPGLMPATADSQTVVSPGSPNAIAIQVGAGGKNGIVTGAAADSSGFTGTPSYFGTPLTAPGGGGGGGHDPAPIAIGKPGGSGGGGGDRSEVTTPGAASPNSDPSRFGYPGGAGSDGGDINDESGGGGGAGGSGGNGTNGSPGVGPTAFGGVGVQLPSIFQNPQSTVGAPGPNSQGYWVAGGGGGGLGSSHPGTVVTGGGPGGPYAGGGQGYKNGTGQPVLNNATENTGGGGGGVGSSPSPPTHYLISGRGGSGLVLIAYDTV